MRTNTQDNVSQMSNSAHRSRSAQAVLVFLECKGMPLQSGQARRLLKIHTEYYLRLDKMRSLVVLLLAGAFSVATPLLGETKRSGKAPVMVHKRSAKSRFQEADGFLGLKFGVPLTSQLPACIRTVYGEQAPAPSFCYSDLSTGELGYARLEQPPELGMAYSAAVLLWNGNVEDVCVTFRNEDFEPMLSLLIRKYGRPTVVNAAVSEGDAGQMLYEGKVYKWQGSHTTIELSEYADNGHESKAVFATNRYLQQLRQ